MPKERRAASGRRRCSRPAAEIETSAWERRPAGGGRARSRPPLAGAATPTARLVGAAAFAPGSLVEAPLSYFVTVSPLARAPRGTSVAAAPVAGARRARAAQLLEAVGLQLEGARRRPEELACRAGALAALRIEPAPSAVVFSASFSAGVRPIAWGDSSE
ncbi:unnamed protein product [Urochloa humidicola]